MDRLLVVAFMVAWGVAEVRAQGRARRTRPGSAAQDRGSLVGLYASIAVGYSLAFTASFTPWWRLPGGQPLWLLVGAVAIAAGLGLRAWAMATLGAAFTYRVETAAAGRLVEAGPYRRIRHPGYAGQLLVLAGVGLALGNGLSVVALLVPVLAGFAWRIRVEEQALRAAFGDAFDAYARRTRRLIPGVC